MDEGIKVWYDPEGDYLEVTLRERAGTFRETAADQVMVKIDADGQVIGFFILKVSALKGQPLDLSLAATQ